MEVFREGGEAEVGDLEVAGGVEEEVLWLEVSVVAVSLKKKAESGDELRGVAAGEGLREAAAETRELVLGQDGGPW